MSPGSPTLALSRRRFWQWVTYWLVIFVATHLPVTGTGSLVIRHADKALHFILFFALTLLGARYWQARRALTAGRLAAWGVLYGIYAALDEWLQQFVGRGTSLEDFWADVAGVAAASALWGVYHRAEYLSEPKQQKTPEL